MIARLKNALFSPSVPSVILAVAGYPDGMIHFVHWHIVPEDGTTETAGYSPFSSTFRLHGTTEKARELIGTLTLYAEDTEGVFTFLDAIASRARESWDGPWLSSPAHERTDNVEATTQLAPGDLHQEGADAIPSQNGRVCSVNPTRVPVAG